MERLRPRRPVLGLACALAACGGGGDDAPVSADAAVAVDSAPSPDASPPPEPAPGRDAAPAAPSAGALSPRERAALALQPPAPELMVDSPSGMGHFTPARQASTYLTGPQSNDVVIQIRDFEADAGVNFGTSPWHVLSGTRYGKPGLRTIWGAGLRHAYKYVVDGERFVFAGHLDLNARPTAIPWNLIALRDGRVIVPDTDGFDRVPAGHPCRTEGPSFLALRDSDADPASPITCQRALQLDEATLRTQCGLGPVFSLAPGSGASLAMTFTGDLVTTVRVRQGRMESTYAVVMDHRLEAVQACGFMDEAGMSNQVVAEPLDAQTTALYFASDGAVVKMTFHAGTKALRRVWARPLALRRRTGTTPTVVNAPTGERLLVLVDGQCAVTNVLNGLIVCDDKVAPSRLIGVRREDDTGGAPAVIAADLPGYIRTVENSPAVLGDLIAIANYSGYLPNGLLVPPGGQKPRGDEGTWGTSADAITDFATGIVVMKYDPRRGFVLAWEDAKTQISGVPTISGGANMVYGTGAEEADGKLYFYGFRLEADDRGPAGARVIRKELGKAPFRQARRNPVGHNVIAPAEYGMSPGELFDAGNNMVLNSDGSLFFPGGRALVRILPR